MARAEIVDGWVTRIAVEEARQRIGQLLAARKVTVIQSSDNEVTGTQGSQFLTRLLGGWFVNPATLPKRIAIGCEELAPGCRVDIRIEETLGFGVLDSHFKSRYEGYFVEFVSALRDDLPPVACGVPDVVAAELVDPLGDK